MSEFTALNGAPASSFCFGTMQFGGGSDAAESEAVFKTCREAGINFFDSAWVYTDGASETILGQLAKAERDSLILTSKGGYVGPSSRENLTAQLDESLRRMQTDYVDIYFIHRFDDDTPLQETFDTLAGMQQAGRIRYIGVSNYAAWQVMKAQGVAAAAGTKIDVIQPMYNLVKRQAEVELLPMCLSEGIKVTPYSPLGGGLLTGKYAKGKQVDGRLAKDHRYAARYALKQMHQTAEDLVELAADKGVDPATLAVGFVAANPAITAPIISARTVEQLRPSLAAMTAPLSPEAYAEIAALSAKPAPATDRLEEA
ncbi:aldo/keto reductase [Neptunicoccus cionae]|uniref:Aldo/keto reductase n=1 Tax=Neptunicoccus cionae TaxID=2035344 RepID=A0A916QRQ1_9RHOB|nr:aldo/keto reductase [Amylibacter cionae]GGA06411.1 aldo/keto reductase [Amylibacter cionae]